MATDVASRGRYANDSKNAVPSAQREVSPVGLINADADLDAVNIARFGKRAQLRRDFGLFSLIALSVTVMQTWEGMLGNLQAVLINGGPSGVVYGMLFTWIGVGSQCLVLAEMGSMIPLSGGQYNWVALLAPPWCNKFLSFATGIFTILGWESATITTFYLCGSYIQGLLIQVNGPDYPAKPYQSVLISYAAVLIVVFINTALARHLPRIEGVLLLAIHLFGFITVVTVLTYFGSQNPASFVFENLQDNGDWGSLGLSFFIGLPASMTAFIGQESSCHLAEEASNSSVVIPKSMLWAAGVNGLLAFGMLVAVLFSMGSVQDALKTPTNFPIIEIFYQAVGSNAGAVGLTSILILSNVASVVGLVASTSRCIWAFSRERGLPGSRWLSWVEPRTKLPIYSILLSAIAAMLLLLIDLGSSVALESFLSLTTAATYASYLIAAVVMLNYRLRHDERKIPYGPFKLGKWGVPITLYMICYTTQGVVFSFFPVYRHVTLETFNWASVVFVGTCIVALISWFAYSKGRYRGPIVEVHLE